jgi:hypothetical protein
MWEEQVMNNYESEEEIMADGGSGRDKWMDMNGRV